MTWGDLFDRAARYAVSESRVSERLTERREGEDEPDEAGESPT